MQESNLTRIDLNLFVVFEAVYHEGSITRAAALLNLSQPAVSHALARLRERLNDDLFVRRGREMVPTVRARTLIQPVREALQGLQGCLGGAPAFDPASARRTFVLGLRDGLEACVLPPLMQALADQAPAIDLQSVTVARRDTAAELAAGRLDLAMDVQIPVPAEIRQQKLASSPLVVMMRSDHPLARGRLTIERYLAARHALVSSRRRGPGLEDFGLAQAGHRRDIALRCQHYQAAFQVVAATDLLLTLPRMLADELADNRFRVCDLPVTLPAMDVFLYWHRYLDGDEGHGWLRGLMASGPR